MQISLEKDFFAAFGIIRYITKIAPIVGDTSPYDEFSGEISKKFVGLTAKEDILEALK